MRGDDLSVFNSPAGMISMAVELLWGVQESRNEISNPDGDGLTFTRFGSALSFYFWSLELGETTPWL